MHHHTIRTLLASAAAACLLVGSAQAATIERRYNPFTADGQPDPSLRITDRFDDASCAGGSDVSGRSDAWRCHSGHFILDPCFESPSQPVAVCPADPLTGRAALLNDPELDPQGAGTTGSATVWAVRTAGRTCVASSGAKSEIRGRVPTYFCAPGFRTVVWGPLDRRHATWRALLGGYKHPEAWRWRSVAIVWR
jgi:hypothetical protein